MARDFVALVGAHVDDAGVVVESSSGLLLLGMIIMSLSIISMVLFACISNDIVVILQGKFLLAIKNF